MTTFLLGCAAGVVAKILIPMPWADDPVRRGWAWLRYKITG